MLHQLRTQIDQRNAEYSVTSPNCYANDSILAVTKKRWHDLFIEYVCDRPTSIYHIILTAIAGRFFGSIGAAAFFARYSFVDRHCLYHEVHAIAEDRFQTYTSSSQARISKINPGISFARKHHCQWATDAVVYFSSSSGFITQPPANNICRPGRWVSVLGSKHENCIHVCRTNREAHLSAVMLVIVFVVRRLMVSVNIEELERLRYDYKGA